MTVSIVLDASVAVTFIRRQQGVADVDRRLEAWRRSALRLCVPSSFWLEVSYSVLRRHRFSARITVEALHQLDFDPAGFSWVDANDSEQSILSFSRHAGASEVLAVFNFTPVPRAGYRIGLPRGGFWREVLNSDAEIYGGSGWGNMGGVEAEESSWHGRPFSVRIALPPLGAVFFTDRR